MINPGWAEKGPGRRGILNRGLAFPGDQGGRWGTPLTIISAVGIPFQPKQKGRRTSMALRPTPLPKCPHTRKEKVSNATMKLRLG
jgi:hypothetical protein